MTMLPPRPAPPSSTSGGEPTTAPEPAEDDAEDTPAGGQFGGFFGTGTGTDMDTGAESETDETTDATDPPANSGTGATFGGGFAGTPTPSATAPAAMTCTPLAVGIASGDIGTEAKCFTVMGTLQGWQVSNLGTRSLTVNDAPAIAPMLPAASDGGYTFAFGAGEPLYTAFSTW
jgi:hypothetical protein